MDRKVKGSEGKDRKEISWLINPFIYYQRDVSLLKESLNNGIAVPMTRENAINTEEYRFGRIDV